jgi:hypothetical protein
VPKTAADTGVEVTGTGWAGFPLFFPKKFSAAVMLDFPHEFPIGYQQLVGYPAVIE